jgi:hypothetical protein
LNTGNNCLEAAATAKKLTQIQQLCESAIKWDEDISTPAALSDRAWLAKCILDILKENTSA